MDSERPAIGIIGGSGWLGAAFASAVVDAGLSSTEELCLSCRAVEKGRSRLPGANWTDVNQLVADRSDLIVLSVRPEQMNEVAIDASGKVVLSFVSGLSAATIAKRTMCTQVVRAMPNAAAEVRRSYTPWYATKGVSTIGKRWTAAVLGCCGHEEEVSSETELDYLGVLTGMGPALPALLAQTMIQDATARGLDHGLARRAVVAVFAGAGRMLDEDPDPEAMVEAYVRYGGVTCAAIEAMVAGSLQDLVSKALRGAEEKTRLNGLLHDGVADP